MDIVFCGKHSCQEEEPCVPDVLWRGVAYFWAQVKVIRGIWHISHPHGPWGVEGGTVTVTAFFFSPWEQTHEIRETKRQAREARCPRQGSEQTKPFLFLVLIAFFLYSFSAMLFSSGFLSFRAKIW